jgi:hypothetical protein
MTQEMSVGWHKWVDACWDVGDGDNADPRNTGGRKPNVCAVTQVVEERFTVWLTA